MIVFVTSCGRPDLLEQTLSSFFLNNPLDKINLIIHEDSKDIDLAVQCATVAGKFYDKCNQLSFIHTQGIGQHASIEKFLREAPDEQYYIHLEDDFEFDNSYDWIRESIGLMEYHDQIIKVLCRKDTEHPCEHDLQSFTFRKWGVIKPWENKGIKWYGFSWNCGVTRLDYLRKITLPTWEQDVAERLHILDYRVAELKDKIYTHIGYNRSTHQ